MKILFINKFFYHNGGAERVFFQERSFFIQQGYRVIDFSMGDERNIASDYSTFFVKKKDYQGNTTINNKIRLATSFVHSREALRKLERLLIQEKPDIAHLHNIYHQITPAIIPLLKSYGVKVVLTLHDYKLICPCYLALFENDGFYAVRLCGHGC